MDSARCRKKRDLEEEAADGASSGEDEFYDRTMETKKKRSKAAAHVEDAASLYGRKVRCPDWTGLTIPPWILGWRHEGCG